MALEVLHPRFIGAVRRSAFYSSTTVIVTSTSSLSYIRSPHSLAHSPAHFIGNVCLRPSRSLKHPQSHHRATSSFLSSLHTSSSHHRNVHHHPPPQHFASLFWSAVESNTKNHSLCTFSRIGGTCRICRYIVNGYVNIILDWSINNKLSPFIIFPSTTSIW